MAGRKALLSFCWPILMGLNFVLTLLSLEFVVFEMGAHAIVWLIFSTTYVPTIDPYIPRSKRPPLLLARFLTWLNTAIDKAVNNLAHRILVRRSPTSCSVFLTRRIAQGQAHQCLKYAHQRFKYAFLLIRHFLYCIWHFDWWRTRHRLPTHRRLLAMSAITAGIARAHQAASASQSPQAIFDSDSFDILVDGGATSCISNSLSDFITPPQDSTVRVKGFNGTTSSTKVGTVIWNILDDSGQRHALQIRNTYYVPDCPLRLLSPQHYSQQENDSRGT
jgi:hypothetical protein